MSDYSARRVVENELRRELFGPLETEAPPGTAVECSEGNIYFEIKEDSYGQLYDAATNQEILTTSTPLSECFTREMLLRGVEPRRERFLKVLLLSESRDYRTQMGNLAALP